MGPFGFDINFFMDVGSNPTGSSTIYFTSMAEWLKALDS